MHISATLGGHVPVGIHKGDLETDPCALLYLATDTWHQKQS